MGWLERSLNLFRRRRVNDQIDEELRFHAEMRAVDFEREGLSPEEARREAYRRLGNVVSLRDRTREADLWVHLETALLDVRYALRLLRRSPVFTLAAGLTLALGIGINTAMFGVLYGVLMRPLPYPEPDRLYLLQQSTAGVGRTRAAPLDYADWRGRSRALDLSGIVGTGFTLTGGGDAELVIGQLVAGDFFGLLGVSPVLGRTFAATELDRGDAHVMVLSHRLWQRRFGADPGIVGSTITANGRSYDVIGVMPPEFSFLGDRYELWVPFPLTGANPDNLPVTRTSRYMNVLGRLRAGVTPAAAERDIAAIAASLASDFPETHDRSGITMSSLIEETVGNVRPALQLLFAAVTLVLLIACGNVMSLLLARFTVRSSEVQVRAALGASRGRVIRQFLTETLVLYAIGTLAGLVLAYWLLELLRAYGTSAIPRMGDIALLSPVLLFAAGVSLVAALVFGLAPAWQTTRPAGALRSAGRTVTSARSSQRLRSAVVISQVAVALCLVSGATLVARSLLNLQSVEKGFEPAGRATFSVVLPAAKFPTPDQMRAFYRGLLESLERQPGFMRVGTTTHLPLAGQDLENSFAVEGYVPDAPDREPVAALRGISPDYPGAMGIALRAGRALTPADDERGAPVVLVNEAFARRYWPGADPLGRRIAVGESGGAWRTVVGVVADVRHRGLSTEARPEVLVPYLQLDPGFLTAWARGVNVVVRTDLAFSAAVDTIRHTVRGLDPSVPVIDPRPMDAVVSRAVAEPMFRTYLLVTFAVVAVALAAIGIFGVLSYLVSERTREIGIRMALGAPRDAIFGDVLAQGAKLVAAGTVLGLAGGALLARWIAALLFQVSPTDPVMLAVAVATLALVGLAAALFPALRAMRVDPLVALRVQ